jgi:hypothetical protein
LGFAFSARETDFQSFRVNELVVKEAGKKRVIPSAVFFVSFERMMGASKQRMIF